MFEAGIEEKNIVNFLLKKLKKSNIEKKLTIIDPYFFSDSKFGKTQRIIANLIQPFNDTLNELEIVTQPLYNKKNYLALKKQLASITIKVVNNRKFHDRFWIIDDSKAFVVGASLNGFGNKHFFIQDDYLSLKDTKAILNLYRDQEIL